MSGRNEDSHCIENFKILNSHLEKIKKEDEEEQWISGEELFTDGSSDEEAQRQTCLRSVTENVESLRPTPLRNKNSPGGNKRTKTRKSRPHSIATTTPIASESKKLEVSGELKHQNDPEQISWRPKRGSIKLASLAQQVVAKVEDQTV